MNGNASPPQVCTNPQGCSSGGVSGARAVVPQGTTYLPPGPRPNPYVSSTFSWFFDNNSSYHGLTAALVQRASRGLSFKANYTFSKILDFKSTVRNTLGANEPTDVPISYDHKLNKGVAAFNMKHQFNASFSYELPFGSGRRWGSGASSFVDKLIGGWQWNGIFTAQGGFPFTTLVGSNISGTGDSNNPDLPNWNPAFSGPRILGKVKQWYDPRAFSLPLAGTFGNVSRNSLLGPGLTSLDTSMFKNFKLNERWNFQFRAEVFNIVNHANFGEPNLVVFSGTNISPSAGIITNTATSSRQIQFALKLGW